CVAWPPLEIAMAPHAESRDSNNQFSPIPGSALSEDSVAPVTAFVPAGSTMRAYSIMIGQGTYFVWFVASIALAIWQIGRIVRFRRRLMWAVPPPAWLREQSGVVAQQLGVRAPEILV